MTELKWDTGCQEDFLFGKNQSVFTALQTV
jgi:hypothetical protein